MMETSQKLDDLYQKDELFSEKAIVILESKEQKRAVVKKFPFISKE